MIKYDYKKLTPFKWFVLENFPFIEADFDALTNWQLYCKLGKEINKIIASQNNVGEQVENVTNAFIQFQKDLISDFTELKNYVDNYFDNLDVQEEINNKLDLMSEDGTLERILTNYTQITKVYNTTAQMIEDYSNLQANQKILTLGYNNINDKGGAYFYITSEPLQNFFNIALNGNLYANIMGDLSPENTNLSLDEFLNNYSNYKNIYFNNNEYNIENPIIINQSVYLDLKGIKINYIGNEIINDLFLFGFDTTQPFINYSGINNLKLNCNTKCKNGLHINGGKSINITNIEVVKPLQYGVLVNDDLSSVWEMNMRDITVNGINDISQCLSAIKLENITDSFFENLYPVNGSESWFYCKCSGCTFNNIHGYSYPEELNTNIGFDIYNNGNKFNNLIIDTPNSIGMQVHSNYNMFKNITISKMKDLENGVGIIDSDSNNYNGIYVSNAIKTIIRSNATNYLSVSNILNPINVNQDIELLQNLLPYQFIYDNSGKATNALTNSFSFLNQDAYIGTPTKEINLPIPFRNTNYNVNVIINRTQPSFYTIKKEKNKVTISFDTNYIGTGLVFDVYVSLPKI